MVERSNPYLTEHPIEVGEDFFGREGEFSWVARGLTRGHRVLVIYGPRRIGKTSFLRQLPRHLPPEYVFLLLSLRPRTKDGPDVLMRQVVNDVVNQLNLPEPEHTSALYDRLLTQVEEMLGEKTLVLAFDEVEKLLRRHRERELLWSFTVHMSTHLERSPKLRLIFALEAVDKAEWEDFPLFERAIHCQLGPLTKDEAISLITRPAKGVLDYDPGAIRRVLDLTSRHPYFIQLLCSILFDRCTQGSYYVASRDVETAIGSLFEREGAYFEEMWAKSTPSEKVVLAGLGTLRGGHGIATQQEVGNALRKGGAYIPQTEVIKALDSLTRRGILEQLGAMSYRFSLDLFRVWVGRYRGVEEALRGWEKPGQARYLLPRTRREFSIAALGLSLAVLAIFMLWQIFRPPQPARQAGTERQTATPQPATSVSATSEATSTPTAQPTPTKPLVVARSLPAIVYMAKSSPDEPWQIYAIDSSGGNVTRLTFTKSNETSPVWSPDGSRILFISDRNGNRDIFVMKSDGTDQVALTDDPADDVMATWSPDRNKIAFVSRRDGNWEIYIMNSDGSELKRLTYNEASDWTPSWSPDGKKIAFASDRDGDWEIYVMDVKRGESSLVRLTFNPATDIAPNWSPRGDRIAFESTRDGDVEIYLMSAEGSALTNLTLEHTANDHWPSWAPDGRRLVFQSNREGDWDIYVMTDRGTDVVNLTAGSKANEQAPAWRP